MMYLAMLPIKAETNKGVEWKLELFFLATGKFELDTVLWFSMGIDYPTQTPPQICSRADRVKENLKNLEDIS
jgi:hypothetical protein